MKEYDEYKSYSKNIEEVDNKENSTLNVDLIIKIKEHLNSLKNVLNKGVELEDKIVALITK